jgi:large subunit ribosomal protein L17
MVNRKLGRTSSHRNAMFRNALASLIENERIVTTLPKAKELRPLIEKLITLGKNDSVHSRRMAAKVVPDDTLIAKLFGPIATQFAERNGGYTRIIKLGSRRGDAAEMAILEFVGYQLPSASEAAAPTKGGDKKKAKAPQPEAEEKPAKKAGGKKAAPKQEAAAEEEKPKKPKKKKEE